MLKTVVRTMTAMSPPPMDARLTTQGPWSLGPVQSGTSTPFLKICTSARRMLPTIEASKSNSIVTGDVKMMPPPSILTCWPNAVNPAGGPDAGDSVMVNTKSDGAAPGGTVIFVMVTSLPVASVPVCANPPDAAGTAVCA
jgi:hypothetical protein